jgi:hypothetical protein
MLFRPSALIAKRILLLLEKMATLKCLLSLLLDVTRTHNCKRRDYQAKITILLPQQIMKEAENKVVQLKKKMSSNLKQSM